LEVLVHQANGWFESNGSVMWRLAKRHDGECMVLVLSGKVDEHELQELERGIARDGKDERVELDLEGLKLVDQVVVNYLSRCESRGVALRNCPPFIREWINRGQR